MHSPGIRGDGGRLGQDVGILSIVKDLGPVDPAEAAPSAWALKF